MCCSYGADTRARGPDSRARQCAGANPITYGDKQLTTGNPEAEADRALLANLGMRTRAEGGTAGCGDCTMPQFRSGPSP